MSSPLGPVFGLYNETGPRNLVLVCEHASRRLPDRFAGLGLNADALESHIAWDIGAFEVARRMSDRLGAPLLHGGISRLVYDCNRPPEAADAIPRKSETFEIPGNRDLGEPERAFRIDAVYRPFDAALADLVAARPGATIATVHTFTPVWFGRRRTVEVGILHGTDPRLATAMMDIASEQPGLDVRLNEPYGMKDGVTHTIDRHGAANGLLNVMLEIRNDLVTDGDGQARMAGLVVDWLEAALARATNERAIAS